MKALDTIDPKFFKSAGSKEVLMVDSPNRVSEDEPRYAEMNIEDEEFVLYDRQNFQAWYQTDVTVDMDNPEESDYWKE